MPMMKVIQNLVLLQSSFLATMHFVYKSGSNVITQGTRR